MLFTTQVVLNESCVCFAIGYVSENEGWDFSCLKQSLYVVIRLLKLHIYINTILAAGSGFGWRVCLCRVHGLTYVFNVEPSTLFHCIIFRACCASEPNTSSSFVRMRALCVYVSVFLYRFEVHIFFRIQNILSQDFCRRENANLDLFMSLRSQNTLWSWDGEKWNDS